MGGYTASGNVSAVSSVNGSIIPLASSGVFTGEWVDATNYASIVVAVKTDQDGTFTVQFSPDGTNADSTLTRYYRTAQIEPPHRFTITRQYVRVTFTNTSTSLQTYFRMQSMLCNQTDLNAPLDSTLSQDFDAIATRPTRYEYEVALGRRQGATVWNKFGYNTDVDIGTEVVASFGGVFIPVTSAAPLSIVSTSGADTDGGQGAHGVVVYGLDSTRKAQVEVVMLTGVTPVVTSSTWMGVNRMALYRSGTGLTNSGVVTASSSSTQAEIPIGEGTTQQCIFYIQADHQALAEWLTITSLKQSGANPVIRVTGWVYSAVSNSKYEVLRINMDTAVSNEVTLTPPIPFQIGEKSCFWLECTTDKADTIISARFSLIEVRDVDA